MNWDNENHQYTAFEASCKTVKPVIFYIVLSLVESSRKTTKKYFLEYLTLSFKKEKSNCIWVSFEEERNYAQCQIRTGTQITAGAKFSVSQQSFFQCLYSWFFVFIFILAVRGFVGSVKTFEAGLQCRWIFLSQLPVPK